MPVGVGAPPLETSLPERSCHATSVWPLNSIWKFTMNMEQNGLSYMCRLKEELIGWHLCTKSIHTHRPLPTFRYTGVKMGIIVYLRQRAYNVCDGDKLGLELEYLQETFEANGYPTKLVRITWQEVWDMVAYHCYQTTRRSLRSFSSLTTRDWVRQMRNRSHLWKLEVFSEDIPRAVLWYKGTLRCFCSLF